MNYELAKKLKDAGFSQDGDPDEPRPTIASPNRNADGLFNYSYLPHLSELIEACGKETLVLWFFQGTWFCGLRKIIMTDGAFLTDTHSFDIDYADYKMGDTPEEAAASLYIALNSGKMKECKEKSIGTGRETK